MPIGMQERPAQFFRINSTPLLAVEVAGHPGVRVIHFPR